MIYVSFVEIFFKGKVILTDPETFGMRLGTWYTILSFFGGMALIAIIDKLVPNVENPHEIHKVEEIDNIQLRKDKLARMGVFTALAIAIHNFPEGLATFTAALSDPSLGIAIAVAIAIHNIPEGIAVSVPVYYATGNRKKAFWLSFMSGLAEPVGAIIGYLILMPFLGDSNVLMGIIFAAVAGIMVFISLDELLPAAREYGEHHLSIYGLVSGMLVMALSLMLFIK
jgi:ZIP family zinc transporter